MIEIHTDQTHNILGRGKCIVFSMTANNLTEKTLPKKGEKIIWKETVYTVDFYEGFRTLMEPPTLKDNVAMFIKNV